MAHAASFLLTITHKKEPSWVLWAWCCFCLDPLGSVNNIMKFAKGHQKKICIYFKKRMQSYSVNLVWLHFFPPRLSSSHLLQHPAPPVEPCPTVWEALSYKVALKRIEMFQMASGPAPKSQQMPWVLVINSREMRGHWLCVCVYTLSFSQMIQSSAWINKLKQSRNWNQEKLQIDNNKANYTSLYTATFSSSQLRSFI